MSLSDYRVLPHEDLAPTHTRAGIPVQQQQAELQRLRRLQNAIPEAQRQRDEALIALARDGILSRRDMARACGLCKSRVDQILSGATTGQPA